MRSKPFEHRVTILNSDYPEHWYRRRDLAHAIAGEDRYTHWDWHDQVADQWNTTFSFEDQNDAFMFKMKCD